MSSKFRFWVAACMAWGLTNPAGAQNADILIRNGRILDGTGNSWYRADLAIKDGKILKIGSLPHWTATTTIDAQHQMVSPGFIDVHTHIENDERRNPSAANFLYDGVTTVITGNCGLSETNLGDYFKLIDSLRPGVNVAALIGHNDVRRAVMGRAMRTPSAAEQKAMEDLVEKAMQAGAVGLSTGLIYIPGTYAQTQEVVGLAKIAAKYQGVYATHMRNESDSVVAAIEEALTIGRLAQIPVQISHFKLSGQQNWGRSKETLPLIIQAREAGMDVTIDQYPYTASSTSLSTLLPDWVLADGQDSIVARLQRPDVRAAAIAHMLKNLKKRKLSHFSYPVVANYKYDTSLNGLSIEKVNLRKSRPHKASAEAETVLEMMEKGGASMVFHGMGDEDVKAIMRYPFNMVASDASIRVYKEGNPHPRGYGTNARVLAKYVRDEKVISLEEAIRRMTSLPAQKFNLVHKGLLKPGMDADVLVFDPEKVQDRSVYENPHQFSEGFSTVIVNGVVAIQAGQLTSNRNGKALRRENN